MKQFALLLFFAAAAFGQITQHIMLLEPGDGKLSVTETFFCKDAFNAYFPDTVTFEMEPPKGNQPNVYRIPCPPPDKEQTDGRVDIAYSMSTPGQFGGKVLYKGLETRMVVPQGLTLAGDGLEKLGAPSGMRANIYSVKSQEYAVTIAMDDSAPAESPGIEKILPRIYDRVYEIVGLAMLILMLGFVLLARRTAK